MLKQLKIIFVHVISPMLSFQDISSLMRVNKHFYEWFKLDKNVVTMRAIYNYSSATRGMIELNREIIGYVMGCKDDSKNRRNVAYHFHYIDIDYNITCDKNVIKAYQKGDTKALRSIQECSERYGLSRVEMYLHMRDSIQLDEFEELIPIGLFDEYIDTISINVFTKMMQIVFGHCIKQIRGFDYGFLADLSLIQIEVFAKIFDPMPKYLFVKCLMSFSDEQFETLAKYVNPAFKWPIHISVGQFCSISARKCELMLQHGFFVKRYVGAIRYFENKGLPMNLLV